MESNSDGTTEKELFVIFHVLFVGEYLKHLNYLLKTILKALENLRSRKGMESANSTSIVS